MATASTVERLRREVQALQRKIATQTHTIAAARDKERRAREQAARATSTTTTASRNRDVDRHNKAAVDAQKRQSTLERQLAEKMKALHQAESRGSKEQAAQQQRILRQVEERGRQADRRFVSGLPADAISATDPPGWTNEPPAHDVFISHASEDKEEVARPLADLLRDRGLVVWYDEFTLTVGDSLRRSIDRGLASSRFGVVILSPHFFRKECPQAEVDGLVARQRASGAKVILPVWHRLTKDDVLAASPTLADLKALNTAVMTMVEIAEGLSTVVESA